MDKIYKKYQGHTIENWISETSPDFKKFAGVNCNLRFHTHISD